MASHIINFKESVSSLGTATDSRRSEVKGKIESVIMHFPPGVNALVDVTVLSNGTQIIPDKGFIALDDATVTFHPDHPVNVGDNITVNVENTDDTNSHTISVIAELIGERRR